MVDPPPKPQADKLLSAPVRGWLGDIAESDGLSERAAIEGLLSAYWKLEEITEVLEGTQGRPSLSSARANEFEYPSLDSQSEFSELDSEVEALSNRIDRLEKQAAVAGTEWSNTIEEAIADLRTRLDYFEVFAASFEAEIEGLSDSAVVTEELDAHRRLSRSFRETITTRQDKLEEQVQTEFEYIRTIIEQLLDRMDSNESRLDRFSSRFDSRLDSYGDERDSLETISRKAIWHDVAVADCEYCALTIDLAKLRRPICPRCGSRFDDLTTKSKLLGLLNSHILSIQES